MSLADNGDDSKENHAGSINTPQITKEDLLTFYQVHFEEESVTDFHQEFLRPQDEGKDKDISSSHGQATDWHEEEDDLGYYADGVKRTLTDEQIEIFRHSELRDLERKAAKEAEETNVVNGTTAKLTGANTDGDASSPAPTLSTVTSGSRVAKKKKKKGRSRVPLEPKPDLRKRTWDIVEKGLDYLDYD